VTRLRLSDAPDPAQADEQRPPEQFTAELYLARLSGPTLFYAKECEQNETWSRCLRYVSLAAALSATVIGAASRSFGRPRLAPWIGVVTTLGAICREWAAGAAELLRCELLDIIRRIVLPDFIR